MTNEPDQTPFPSKESCRPRHKRQREALNAAMSDGPTKTRPLKPGPGRTCILDPDQCTLDENIRRLYTFASLQATLEEAAAGLGVSLDTLRAFFHRYPTVKEKWDDYRLTGVATIRAQLFQNLTKDPATTRFMADRIGGIENPYKRKELDLRERALAQQQEEFRQSIELKTQELAQRERALRLKEQQFDLKTSAFGPGLPINIKELSNKQLAQLIERIRIAQEDVRRLTIEGVKQLPG